MGYLNIFYIVFSIKSHIPSVTTENAKMYLIISSLVVDEVAVSASLFSLPLTFQELLELLCAKEKPVLFRVTLVF